MDFLDLAKKRCSVRSYQDKPVEKEKIDTILQAGWVAPTAANLQPNRFLVLNDEQSLCKLAKATNPHGAPLAIIVCAEKTVAFVRPFDKASMADIDAAIATDHMMLQAEDLGLGSCWLTYFDPAIIKREFNIPETIVPVNILVIGYADGEPASPERHSSARKPLNSMVLHKSF
jgi:nitroreductase